VTKVFISSDIEGTAGIHCVQRAGARMVTVTDDDPLRLYRTFVTIIALTRSIVER
jgi:D-amino peptidase